MQHGVITFKLQIHCENAAVRARLQFHHIH